MPSRSSPTWTRSKCARRLVAEVLGDLRRVLDDVLPVVALAVEHAERVLLHPLAEVGAERVGVVEEVGAQLLDVRCPARRVAHRVEEQREPLETEGAVEAVGERDHLDVDIGIVDPQRFDADLPVLAVAPLLRTLVAEVRREVPAPSTGSAGGAARRRAPPPRCPRAAARAGGRPCPRTRTSPCARRRSTRRRAGTPRGARRSGVTTRSNPNRDARARRTWR